MLSVGKLNRSLVEEELVCIAFEARILLLGLVTRARTEAREVDAFVNESEVALVRLLGHCEETLRA